jgi:hypothetical protein
MGQSLCPEQDKLIDFVDDRELLNKSAQIFTTEFISRTSSVIYLLSVDVVALVVVGR